MDEMNFDKVWISWIKELFFSSSISVLVNGSPTGEFTPKRGLRQGDPVSPLLFNLVGEILSKLLSRANSGGIFNGITLPNCVSQVTHLQYADDVTIFIENEEGSIRGVKRVLQCFELLSGLKINYQKSCLYSINEDADRFQSWASILGCSAEYGPFRYLGATIGSSPHSLSYLEPLISKMNNKLKAW